MQQFVSTSGYVLLANYELLCIMKILADFSNFLHVRMRHDDGAAARSIAQALKLSVAIQ